MIKGYIFLIDYEIISEEDGTFSGLVLTLPGVGSCGDTREELKVNIEDAVKGVLGIYKTPEEVPWGNFKFEDGHEYDFIAFTMTGEEWDGNQLKK